LDIKKRPNIHLLDGGLSDNMALRGLIEGVTVVGGLERFLKEGNLKGVRKFVVLAVNAETTPDVLEYRVITSRSSPGRRALWSICRSIATLLIQSRCCARAWKTRD